MLYSSFGQRRRWIIRRKRKSRKPRCKALIKPVDVADAAKVEEVAEEIENQLGPIDVWINNAMVSVFSPISEILPEEYKRVTEVTYLGQLYGINS